MLLYTISIDKSMLFYYSLLMKNLTATEVRLMEEEFYKKDHFPSLTKISEDIIDIIYKKALELENEKKSN